MSPAEQTTGRSHWRSLDELANRPAFRQFLESEFPNLPAEFRDGPSRRQFLKLMGASLGLAGLTACRWPKETIVPATRQPYDRIPGEAVHYATAIDQDGVGVGVLVTSYDGRPIKIEGNDQHPFSRGKTDARTQASVLDVYDPDRSRWPVRRPDDVLPTRRWEELETFVREHFAKLRQGGGADLAILAGATSSPSVADMRARFVGVFPRAAWYEYQPISRDNERLGATLAFGRPLRTQLDLARADVVVSFDSDFLGRHPAAVRYAADFAARRRIDRGTMSRLYVMESGLSITGSVADERYPLRPSAVGLALAQLAAALADRLQQPSPLPLPLGEAPIPEESIAGMADDLLAHRGRCVIAVGARQPAEVHAAAHVLNTWLDAAGHTVHYRAEPDPERPAHPDALATLVQRMQAGTLQTLVILGGNPVYDAPADLDFAGALARVPTTLHLSVSENETSQRCTWHVPQAHYLESWGDARAWDGTISIVQPLIEPLSQTAQPAGGQTYQGNSICELLALLSGDELRRGYDITRRTLRPVLGGDDAAFEQRWRQALHDGVLPDSAWPVEQDIALQSFETPTRTSGTGFEIVFVADYKTYDGRYANNGWLQELPDPITKLTWDNAALLAPADAERLQVSRNGELLAITLGERTLTVPAYVLPGQPAGVITLPLGYGRTAGGCVGEGVGFNTYTLRTHAGFHGIGGAQVRRTGGVHELAGTQDHHAIRSDVGDQEEQQRVGQLAREVELATFLRHPGFHQPGEHHLPMASLWTEREYLGHKWGMAIDLSACIGCGACVVACQAENNIPVVGKDEVAMGREMHWIRIDRYFRGQPQAANIRVMHQPVTCMHCELAPCEQVCPVAATVHDTEGLNAMVYNRCIGTRYCSNNCPYKVRRFNWFYNHHGPAHPRSLASDRQAVPGIVKQEPIHVIEMLQHNPNVTVRSRGVMEKCTFCVQRIAAVKIQAKNERWSQIPDGAVTPACGQACPTDAITFGDLNDKTSRVHQLHADDRAYALLEFLNIKPRTKYLARVHNPRHTQDHEGDAHAVHGGHR